MPEKQGVVGNRIFNAGWAESRWTRDKVSDAAAEVAK